MNTKNKKKSEDIRGLGPQGVGSGILADGGEGIEFCRYFLPLFELAGATIRIW
jgi:hypothetical protein